jgi:transcriptional regulator with XRE-family HTH domain
MSNLKELRTNRNLSQSKLSELSGVNARMIQYYEQGVKDINKAQGLTLQALAQALECKIEDILELE